MPTFSKTLASGKLAASPSGFRVYLSSSGTEFYTVFWLAIGPE